MATKSFKSFEAFAKDFKQFLHKITPNVAKATAKATELYWVDAVQSWVSGNHQFPAYTTGNYAESIKIDERRSDIDDAWYVVGNVAEYAEVLERGGEVPYVTLADIERWAAAKNRQYGAEFDAEAVFKKVKNEGIEAWYLGMHARDTMLNKIEQIVDIALQSL